VSLRLRTPAVFPDTLNEAKNIIRKCRIFFPTLFGRSSALFSADFLTLNRLLSLPLLKINSFSSETKLFGLNNLTKMFYNSA